MARPRKPLQKQSGQIAPAPTNHAATKSIPLNLIDPSPLNYRTYYDPEALERFSQELSRHGVISAVTVRPGKNERYELVVGERRYRASKLAKLKQIPAMIRELSDDEVIEMQLSENLQREDPHPLHTSFAIQRMQKAGLPIEEIAARLGKSPTFIYNRTKLAGLIEEMQDVFLAGKINLQQAFEIALLAQASQQEFYEQHCKNWKQKNFALHNLYNLLSRFRYDLKRAPFDPKDKKLNPEMGACTKCPFNSATLKSLFPELTKEAVCTNHHCYQNKCDTHIIKTISEAIREYQPSALVYCYNRPEILDTIPEAAQLPHHNRYEINVYSERTMPQREDFIDENEETGEEEFDQEAFDEAMQEYESDLVEYEVLIQQGKVFKGLQINNGDVELIMFSLEKRNASSSKPSVTAKQVQEAITSGTATPTLIQQEIERLTVREKRSKELDREKVQLTLYAKFKEQFSALENNESLTISDLNIARLIVYESLDYSSRAKVNEALKLNYERSENIPDNQYLYEALATLTEQQYSYLLRMAIASKSESKYPNSAQAYALYKTAESILPEVALIEQEQKQKAEQRATKLQVKLTQMETLKAKLDVA